MRILISSHFFHPSVGGIEEVSLILAREFVAAGHRVTVVTQTLETGELPFPLAILRQPSRARLWQAVRDCEVFFHNNISLKTAWPLLLARKPWVIAHHTWIARTDGRSGWQDRAKKALLARAQNIAISESMRAHLGVPAEIIGNPFRDEIFRRDSAAVRDRELIFVGRLVSDKGVDLLLTALAGLRARGLFPHLSIVGSGPEESALRAEVARQNLGGQVEFCGQRRGPELVALLNRHRLIVVPSRWREPFGLVALEGLACGCLPVVADGGGLPEAIGKSGVIFRRGDAADLENRFAEVLGHGIDLDRYFVEVDSHLASHSARTVAAKYLRVFQAALSP